MYRNNVRATVNSCRSCGRSNFLILQNKGHESQKNDKSAEA